MSFQTYRMDLVRYRDVSPLVRSFECRLTDAEDFCYKAGQHISLDFTLEGSSYTRYYSLASEPAGGGGLEFCAKYVEGAAATRYLWGIEPGALLQMRGPFGAFVLREPFARDSLFIATGTGIAPIRAMLRTVLRGRGGPRVTLLFGARNEAELLFHAEFLDLERRNSNFTYLTVLSRPQKPWTGLQGYVQHHLDDAPLDPESMDVYVCGWKGMVDEIRRGLEDKGFPESSIHYERTAG